MIDEPVPTMPEMVPAISPTMRTKRKPKKPDLRDGCNDRLLLTPCCQQAPSMNPAISGHREGTNRASQGKLPLRPDAIRGQRDASRRDPLHLFVVRQARRAVGLLYAGAISADVAAGKRRDLSLGQPHRQTSFLRQLRLRHLFGIAGLVDRQAGL